MGIGCTVGLGQIIDLCCGLWAPTIAPCAISAVAELLVTKAGNNPVSQLVNALLNEWPISKVKEITMHQ